MDDVRDLDAELAEVDLLVGQAETESARHAARRSAAADKLTALQVAHPENATELLELSTQLVTLTKRAALMESQVDVLEGKRRALGRYRDAVRDYASITAELADPGSRRRIRRTRHRPRRPDAGRRLPPGHDDAGGPAPGHLPRDA